jgi:hypothetical protein
LQWCWQGQTENSEILMWVTEKKQQWEKQE